MPFSFRFRLVPFIAMLVVAAIGVSLGQWQLRRAAEKQAIEQRIRTQEQAPPLRLDSAAAQAADVAALEFRQVTVRGEFLPGWTIYLDNRPHEGKPGFHVLTPLKIAGSGRHIIVARGWIERDVADRSRIATIATPAGMVEITGTVRRHAGRLLQLGQPAALKPGAIVQNLDVAALAQASGLDIASFIVEQTGGGDSLVHAWPRPSLGMDRNQGYAFQWFALAATALLFFVVTGFKRGSK
ncbi:MAG: SURF1 family protein [Noviherbaspirillum sp.]